MSPIFASAISFMFVLKEMHEGISGGVKAYFSSGWNILDLLTYTCVPFCTFYTARQELAAGGSTAPMHGYANIVLSLSALWVCINLTGFLRPFTITGPFVRMFIQVVADMKAFMTLMIIYWFSFGLAFSTLLSRNPLWNGWNGYIYVFQMIFGQMEMDDYWPWVFDIETQAYNSSNLLESSIRDLPTNLSYYIGQVYLIAYMVMIGIVLLNLLIAIMGHSYDNIRVKQVVRARMDRADIIAQLDSTYSSLIIRVWNFRLTHRKRVDVAAVPHNHEAPAPDESSERENDLPLSNGVYPRYLHILGSVELLQDSGGLRETELDLKTIWNRLLQLEEKVRETDSTTKAFIAELKQVERDSKVHRENVISLLKAISSFLESNGLAAGMRGTVSASADPPPSLRTPASRSRLMSAPSTGMFADLKAFSRTPLGSEHDVHVPQDLQREAAQVPAQTPKPAEADAAGKRRADTPFDEVPQHEARIVTS